MRWYFAGGVQFLGSELRSVEVEKKSLGEVMAVVSGLKDGPGTASRSILLG